MAEGVAGHLSGAEVFDALGKKWRGSRRHGHAVVGGVVANVSGGNAKAGAAGAAAGELAAHAATHLIADGKSTQDLTQSEREQISQWGQIAGGVAGGLAGGGKNHAAEIGAGAQAGKNAVENNYLYAPEWRNRKEEIDSCGRRDSKCKEEKNEKYSKLIDERFSEAKNCSSTEQCLDILDNINQSLADIHDLREEIYNKGSRSTNDDRFDMILAGSQLAIDQMKPFVLKNLRSFGRTEEAQEEIEYAIAFALATGAKAGGKGRPIGSRSIKNSSSEGKAAKASTSKATAAIGEKSVGPYNTAEKSNMGYNKVKPYQPNKDAVDNMGTLLKQPGFGSDIRNNTTKTKDRYDGQAIYKADRNFGNVKKGDLIYLDGQHKNHLEVFDKNGNFKAVFNLDGSINRAKTDSAKGRKLK